jgi:hypothetical protein
VTGTCTRGELLLLLLNCVRCVVLCCFTTVTQLGPKPTTQHRRDCAHVCCASASAAAAAQDRCSRMPTDATPNSPGWPAACANITSGSSCRAPCDSAFGAGYRIQCSGKDKWAEPTGSCPGGCSCMAAVCLLKLACLQLDSRLTLRSCNTLQRARC